MATNAAVPGWQFLKDQLFPSLSGEWKAMHGLVGYGSSSEEEDNSVKPIRRAVESPSQIDRVADTEPPSLPNRGDQDLQAVGYDPTKSDEVLQDVQGPQPNSMTALNGVEDHALSTPSPALPVESSEKDVIRYLTQATVPMTSMPESPPGSPDPATNARFAKFHELKRKGVRFNEDLARKSSFKNPGLFLSLLDRAGLDIDDQYSSAIPGLTSSPNNFPTEAFKENLLASQQEQRNRHEMSKKTLSVTGKRVIEFAPANNSAPTSRKSTPVQLRKKRRP